ncbi:type IV secretion system protein VirB3 [Massilia sp. TW-1]|uniref:Type IV secretion system protein VirB3 n=1 Tax=Telluria antibiotica TaxID=2717319 RepID=A0ABX0P5Q8_9BURK|nr:VirB3 family type IV secretion system protein [Telluria antibiotica]NIA52546.1 type IV secretion system protein VirB3 [Telluria antibiotica]
MEREEGIDVDLLAVALTRPSTILGVPYEACMVNILVSVEALSLTENLLWLLMCIPVHGICYLITLNDPRSFELLLLWARTTLGTLIATRWHWHASSYSPLSFRERFGSFRRWRIKRNLKLEVHA